MQDLVRSLYLWGLSWGEKVEGLELLYQHWSEIIIFFNIHVDTFYYHEIDMKIMVCKKMPANVRFV